MNYVAVLAMKYFLRIYAIGKYPEIKLDKKQFENLKEARELLSFAFTFEEKYELLIRNYYEFENHFSGVALGSIVNFGLEYQDSFEYRMQFNRLLVNFLTAARLYRDQVKELAKENPSLKLNSKALFDEKKSESKSFRFVEQLRNFVQHRGLAVHQYKYSASWKNIDNEEQREHIVQIFAEKETLAQDPDFSKPVLNEIESKVNLQKCIRSYMLAISQIHTTLRSNISEKVDSSRKTVEEAINEYSKEYKESYVGLHALSAQNDKIIDSVPLILEWDDIRIRLSRKNRELTGIDKAYIKN